LSYVNSLAENGFVVFKIDLRGHDQSEGEAGGGYYSGDYVIDTLNAQAALASSDFVNPDAIGLWGHSMAGNVTFRSFIASGKIPAIVVWAGAGYSYMDLQSYQIQDISYKPPPPDSVRARKRQQLRNLYGDFDPDSNFWKQVPPTNYLEGASGAIQINHAVNDNVVSIEYSRNLMAILEGSQIIHELNEYPSGGHNLEGATFNQAMQKTVEFFEKYLK
jgi:dipeptidyl aminopeptidase/acylaminoacyl peptidase